MSKKHIPVGTKVQVTHGVFLGQYGVIKSYHEEYQFEYEVEMLIVDQTMYYNDAYFRVVPETVRIDKYQSDDGCTFVGTMDDKVKRVHFETDKSLLSGAIAIMGMFADGDQQGECGKASEKPRF